MVTLSAFDTGPPKTRDGRAGRATQVMVLTVVKVVIWRVDRRVKLNRLKSPPMELMEELEMLTKLPAFWQVKLPLICCGPSMLIVPEAEEPITMLPEMVEQEAYWLASAWELMVAVG